MSSRLPGRANVSYEDSGVGSMHHQQCRWMVAATHLCRAGGGMTLQEDCCNTSDMGCCHLHDHHCLLDVRNSKASVLRVSGNHNHKEHLEQVCACHKPWE